MKKLTSPKRKVPSIRQKKSISTIQGMVEQSCEEYKDSPAFSIPRDGNIYELTYSEVFGLVKKLANYLQDHGLKKGDHIAILGENCPEWGISYFAINWIGAVAIPLDARGEEKNLEFILKFSDSKAIILSNTFLETAKKIQSSYSELKTVIEFQNIKSLASKYEEGIEKNHSNTNDLCEILFTSGTTGNPKGVMLTNGNLMSNVENIYSFLDLREGDIAFSILPIHHAYEKTCGLLATFHSGVHVFYSRSIKPKEMLEDLKKAKPTVWINTPLVLEKLIQRIQRELASQKGLKKLILRILPKKTIGKKIKKQMGLENIRLIVSGGAALPLWVANGLRDFGFPVIQGYGLSETAPLISANPPSNPKNKSVGMIIDSDEVEIRDLDELGNGEIWVKGPNIMKGYYKNNEATQDVFSGDWLNTGDVGYLDEDSYLYITGRKKNIIVTKGGKNIYPEEIEETLLKSIIIAEALVFSPDDSSIQAIIYPEPEDINFNDKDKLWNLMNSEIRKINKTLSADKRIIFFAIRLTEFPKTTTRKIKRFCFKDINLNETAKFL